MHPVAQHREDNEFLKQNAELFFKYRKLIQGHAWFPYVPVPLQIPGIRQVPLGAYWNWLATAARNSVCFARMLLGGNPSLWTGFQINWEM